MSAASTPLIDPVALTRDLPAPITAATGMDALTHNVESYLSPAYHPLCDGIAVEGVRIAGKTGEGAQALLVGSFVEGEHAVEDLIDYLEYKGYLGIYD